MITTISIKWEVVQLHNLVQQAYQKKTKKHLISIYKTQNSEMCGKIKNEQPLSNPCNSFIVNIDIYFG